MLKFAMTSMVVAALVAPAALAGPAERLGRFDKALTRAEARGDWAQGSRADLYEDRIDRFEDRVDRRESVRDRQVTHGPWDRAEDVLDWREGRRDRLENRIDRRR